LRKLFAGRSGTDTAVARDAMSGNPARLLLRDFLDRQPLLALINVVVATLTAGVLAVTAPEPAALAWLLAMLVAQAGRVAAWVLLRPDGAIDGRRAPLVLTLASGVTGLVWGAAGVLLTQHDVSPVSILVPFVLAGMAAGSITALPAHPPAFFVFIWAALLPYALHLALSPGPISRAMAAITLLYAAGLSAVGWQVHRTLRRAAEVNLQNATLVVRLDDARQGLEATVATRTMELRATNAALLREVAERRRSEDRVRHLLAHDPLTNLPNRLLVVDRIQQALARSTRYGSKTAVVVFDIDRFKDVNDLFGHPSGDRLLRELAERIRAAVRGSDTVARLGGDEFALVAPDLADAGETAAVAQRLLDACRPPFLLDEGQVQVTISIGAAVFPEHGQDADALLRAADAALYLAKGAGKDRVALYSQALHSAQEFRRRLEAELRHAAERGQFGLAYQPRFDLASRRLIAVEALLRWRHPEFGALPTDQFIAVAEASGLIGDIGRWVLAAACEQARRWRDGGHPIRIAVNLSAVEFRHPNLPQQIGGALDRVGLEPDLLELEITESAYMEREADKPHPGVEEVRRLGVRLAIDDFGTGWSSLAYLKWLPFDVLKIDRSFVRNLGDDPRDEAIIATIVTLARQLDKTVVAEGVETERQLAALRRLGCQEGQGFLLGRPAAADTIAGLLAA
jgi:diguanylate cyclase (GGDEF)-like protein